MEYINSHNHHIVHPSFCNFLISRTLLETPKIRSSRYNLRPILGNLPPIHPKKKNLENNYAITNCQRNLLCLRERAFSDTWAQVEETSLCNRATRCSLTRVGHWATSNVSSFPFSFLNVDLSIWPVTLKVNTR